MPPSLFFSLRGWCTRTPHHHTTPPPVAMLAQGGDTHFEFSPGFGVAAVHDSLRYDVSTSDL